MGCHTLNLHFNEQGIRITLGKVDFLAIYGNYGYVLLIHGRGNIGTSSVNVWFRNNNKFARQSDFKFNFCQKRPNFNFFAQYQPIYCSYGYARLIHARGHVGTSSVQFLFRYSNNVARYSDFKVRFLLPKMTKFQLFPSFSTISQVMHAVGAKWIFSF